MIELDLGGLVLKLERGSAPDPNYDPRAFSDDRPFWAYLWPSASAAARLIWSGPQLDGKRVLDLGCGLGAAGFAAAAKGATAMLADIRPEAIALAEKNAATNGLQIEARVVDWDDPPPDLGRFDGIVAADVLYDDGMLRGVLRFMRHHLAPGGRGLIADPMRVLPGGLTGAARLHGLESTAWVHSPGTSVIGGVTFYELWKKR